jgi:hypothetical protein
VYRKLGGKNGVGLELGIIIFLNGKGNESHQLGTGFFLKSE